ncbi:restriction endonuclease subunit S [Agrobacterium tumefaciens]|nr:restriction endonuclease subunit S [Agrobacterium tumefaciens]
MDGNYHRAFKKFEHLGMAGTRPLGSLLKAFFSGGTPSKSVSAYWAGEIPWASPKDFGPFILRETEDHITQEAVTHSAAKIANKGSVLVVVRSSVLAHTLPVAITARHMAINQDIKALVCKDDINPEFLASYLLTFGDQILPLITKHGVTVQSVNTPEFRALPIPILDGGGQQRIAARYSAAIDTQKQKLADANALLASIDDYLLAELGIILLPEPKNTIDKRIFRAKASDLGGWRFDPLFHSFKLWHAIEDSPTPSANLGRFCRLAKTGFAAGGNMQLHDDDGIIQIRPTNIGSDRQLKFDRNVYLDRGILHTQPTDVLQRREVLFNNTNSQEQVGKTAFFDIEGEFLCSNHITRIATNEAELLPEYLTSVLNAYQRLKVFYSICTNWNNQSGVNVDLLRKLIIPVPSVRKQQAIAEEISGIYEQANALRRQAADELDNAKKEIEAILLGGSE